MTDTAAEYASFQEYGLSKKNPEELLTIKPENNQDSSVKLVLLGIL